MNETENDSMAPADAAKVFAGIFGRTADRVTDEKGVPIDVVAKALVAAGLERWLWAEAAELIGLQLRRMADQIDPPTSDLGIQ